MNRLHIWFLTKRSWVAALYFKDLKEDIFMKMNLLFFVLFGNAFLYSQFRVLICRQTQNMDSFSRGLATLVTGPQNKVMLVSKLFLLLVLRKADLWTGFGTGTSTIHLSCSCTNFAAKLHLNFFCTFFLSSIPPQQPPLHKLRFALQGCDNCFIWFKFQGWDLPSSTVTFSLKKVTLKTKRAMLC